jgi:hypothetical protein
MARFWIVDLFFKLSCRDNKRFRSYGGSMIKRLKPVGILLLVLVLVSVFAPGVFAGDLEPPAGPDDAGSAMYTLEDAYNRLDTGAAGAKRTGGFTEPSSAPGSTGVTLDEVMSMMPAADDTDGAAPEDVAAGKTYWGLRTDGTWGLQTGTSATCATCSGTLSAGGRWCDQGDGTVKDMSTGLVWLQNAAWGGQKLWRNSSTDCSAPDYTCYDDAHSRAGTLAAGAAGAGLSDGSVEGDWHLPTKAELSGLANGTEAIRSGSPGPFTGVQSYFYWSSTTIAADPVYAWGVALTGGGTTGYGNKYNAYYVWPVRAGQ